MAIVHCEHNKNRPFVILDKKGLEDDLSWAAKGLWAYLISKPKDWNIQISHLAKIFSGRGGGEKSIYKMLKELRKAGYCELKKEQSATGRFKETSYTINEIKKSLPHAEIGEAVTKDPIKESSSGKQRLKKSLPRAEVRHAVKRHLTKEPFLPNNEIINNGAKAPTAPPAPLRSCAVGEPSEKSGEELIVYAKKSATTDDSDISTDAISKHTIVKCLRKKGYNEKDVDDAIFVYNQTLKPVKSFTAYLIGILNNKTTTQKRTYGKPNPESRPSYYQWSPNPERTAPELFA